MSQRKPGRPPGAKNKKTSEQVRRVQKSGLTPLEYMLSVMRDESLEKDERLDAAKAAAPYIHAKLSSTDTNITVNKHEQALDDLDDGTESDDN